MTVENQKRFADSILKAFGLAHTANRVNFLYAWFAAEGTKALYNPLATTWNLKSKGSTFFNCLARNPDGSCKVGVQNYPTYAVGLEGTVKTLKQDFYKPIIEYLQKGSNVIYKQDQEMKKAFDTWGTKYDNFLAKYGSKYKAVVKSGTGETNILKWLLPIGIGLLAMAASKKRKQAA